MLKNFIFYVVTIVVNAFSPTISMGLDAALVKCVLAVAVHLFTASVTALLCCPRNMFLEALTGEIMTKRLRV